MAERTKDPDVGIYIRGCSIEQACSWLKGRLLNLRCVEPDMDLGPIYWGDYNNDIVAVMFGLIPDYSDNSEWLEVWMQSRAEIPWVSDVACARDAFSCLGLEVRCDPGELRKSLPMNPCEWWGITDKAEGLIFWDTEEPESD